MTLNLDALKKRLNTLKQTTKKSDSLWKPEKTETTVRIVPYKLQPDNPFIELYFHYGIGDKTLLSPFSFNKPDPIVELSEKLKSTGDRDQWRLGKKIEPKLRTFAPVVVRGKESEGVKFWGFGKTVYQELLGYIADPDWGDITDIFKGHDIVVLQQQEKGRTWPSTIIRISPKQTVLTSDKVLFNKLMESQKDIREIYEEKTYDELYDILHQWLDKGETNEVETEPAAEETEPDEVPVDTADDEDDTAEKLPPVKKTEKKEEVPAAANIDAIKAEFERLFKKS